MNLGTEQKYEAYYAEVLCRCLMFALLATLRDLLCPHTLSVGRQR
jgi:hypothetical protein